MSDQHEDPIQSAAAKIEGEKYCTHCGILKPYELFHKDASRQDGYKDVCRECRSEIDKEQRKRVLDDRIRAVDDEGMEALGKMTPGGSYDPHINEVFEAVLRPFGGVNGWAKHLFATYLAAEPGSARRVKIHDMIMQLAGKVTKLGLAERQLDMMEERDLLNVMRQYLTEYQSSNDLPSTALPDPRGGIIDASELDAEVASRE